MNVETEKKKIFKMLMPVRDFMRDQPGEIKKELNGIFGVWSVMVYW